MDRLKARETKDQARVVSQVRGTDKSRRPGINARTTKAAPGKPASRRGA